MNNFKSENLVHDNKHMNNKDFQTTNYIYLSNIAFRSYNLISIILEKRKTEYLHKFDPCEKLNSYFGLFTTLSSAVTEPGWRGFFCKNLKFSLSSLRLFLAIEIPLKMMKNVFYFT